MLSQLPVLDITDLEGITSLVGMTGLTQILSDPDALTDMLVNSEKVHAAIKKIRLHVAREIIFHGPKNEVAIREAIRGKIISASILKPILAASRHRLSWAAKVNAYSGLNATEVSNKLQSLVSYIPDHMLHASLVLEYLKPQYEAFKNTPFDYLNDAELGKIMATLSEADSANLLRLIKTYRELILNYSAGYFELVASIEETRIRSGYTQKKIARLTREVITAFMSATEKNTDFVISTDMSLKTTVQIEHTSIQKILNDSNFNYQNPSAFYTGIIQSEAFMQGLSHAMDLSLEGTLEKEQKRGHVLTTEIRKLKSTQKETDKKLAKLKKDELNKAREAKQRENLKNSRQAKQAVATRSLEEIYTNGNIAELKLRRFRVGAVDLFQAVRAGNKPLTHKLQSIKGINLNEFFIDTIGEPAEAKEEETGARCAIMVAADDNREDLVKILLRNSLVHISEKTLTYIISSPSINLTIKNIISAYQAKQLLKHKPVTTPTPVAAPSPATCVIVDKTAVATSKPEECDDNQIEMAKQYFSLFNQTQMIPDTNILINTIESSLADLRQKSTTDASLESFFMSQNFKFNEAKKKFSRLVEEEKIIVAEFKKLSLVAAKKSHLKVARNISLVKAELAEINGTIESKLKLIAAAEEHPDEKKEEARPLSPLVVSTLFSASSVERVNYQASIHKAIEKIFAFTEFTFPESLEQAEMMTSQNLQLHAILFEIMKLMEIRKKAHPQFAQDPNHHFSSRLHEALLHCKGLIEESPSPDTLQTLTAEVINFSRKLIGAARSNDFSVVTNDSFYLRAHAHGVALEKHPETNTENDSLVYTFSTCGQNLKFSTYSQPLPAGMQYSALCMVNSKAVIYDGYETPLEYLKTACSAPPYCPPRDTSKALGKP